MYLTNNREINSGGAAHSSHYNKESNKVLHAIEAGSLILNKSGGKLLLFNASSSWIKSNKINLEGNKKYNQLPKNELIYTVMDPEGYLNMLGRKLTTSLISMDIFQASSYSASKSFTVSKKSLRN
jgi:hypothetical protein